MTSTAVEGVKPLYYLRNMYVDIVKSFQDFLGGDWFCDKIRLIQHMLVTAGFYYSKFWLKA